jgi:DNA polymerase-3 subunit delta'
MDWSVVGHEQQKKLFEDAIASGRLAHAYALVGPGGVGKFGIACDIARRVVGQEVLSASVDVLVVKPDEESSGVSVETIRQMVRPWVQGKPRMASRKVLVMNKADTLSMEAANALLKILEEPPSQTVFLLVADDAGRLPATVRSRCQIVAFVPLSYEEFASLMNSRGLEASTKLLSQACGNCPGRALKLAQDGKLDHVARIISDFERMVGAGVTARIRWAQEMADNEQAGDDLLLLLSYMHHRLESNPALAPVVRALATMHDAWSGGYANMRLAFESALLQLP